MSRWRRVEEIASDRVLRYYGVALAASNVLTFAHWRSQGGLGRIIGSGAQSICWPLWEGCWRHRPLSGEAVDAALWGYLALSVATGLLFLAQLAAWGWVGTALVNLVRVAVVAQDYRLRLNQHYMLDWVVLVFLLAPARRVLLPWLITSFYFWAGLLKLDREWLTGAAIYGREHFWVPDRLVAASCVYVVVLETLLVFGLLSRRSWLRWATLAQLALFHAASWPIVGFYYPLLMLCLLSIFPLAEWRDRAGGPPGVRALARARRAAAPVLGGFALLQVVPWLFPGDTALTGEGRLFALHMFDARVTCEASATVHTRDGRTREVPISLKGLPVRTACDPIVYWSLSQQECASPTRSPELGDFDLHLRSRRASEAAFHEVIAVTGFCAAAPHYQVWRHNHWIGN